jgi:hypothetical protein
MGEVRAPAAPELVALGVLPVVGAPRAALAVLQVAPAAKRMEAQQAALAARRWMPAAVLTRVEASARWGRRAEPGARSFVHSFQNSFQGLFFRSRNIS